MTFNVPKHSAFLGSRHLIIAFFLSVSILLRTISLLLKFYSLSIQDSFQDLLLPEKLCKESEVPSDVIGAHNCITFSEALCSYNSSRNSLKFLPTVWITILLKVYKWIHLSMIKRQIVLKHFNQSIYMASIRVLY